MQNAVVLDPGHGGTQHRGNATPYGASLDNGQLEERVNFQLAQQVARHLGGAHLTRGSHDSRSLGERVEVARFCGADAFISLHTSPGARGDVWVHPRGGAESIQLAESIRAQLNPALGNSGASVSRGELAVLNPEHHARGTAACLVELGYHAAYGGRSLADPAALEIAAAAIARGVRGHLGRRVGSQRPISQGQIAPAVVSAGVAVGALGYNIVKDALMNEGDIHYQTTRMEGVYFPARDTNPARWQQYAAPEPYQAFSREIGVWSENLIGDRVAANFTVEWWGNGYAVAAARMTLSGTNDAVGWGLNVESDMMPLPTLFGPTGGPYTIAGLGLRATYRFNRSIGSDRIAREDIRLFGDGDSSYSLTWVQS